MYDMSIESFPTICTKQLIVLKFSQNQSTLRHVSAVATIIIKEFTLKAKEPLLKLFVLFRTHNKSISRTSRVKLGAY